MDDLTPPHWNADPLTDCPSCQGMNTSCPDGCGRDPLTGELDGSTLTKPSDVDGLIERLQMSVAYDAPVLRKMCAEAATTLAAQQARVEALEGALKRIAEGDEPRPVATSWFPDGRASKHDKCAHDVWMYEACGNCISDFAAAALKEPTT